MTLKELIDLYDDPMCKIKINDVKLNKIWSGKVKDIQNCKWKPVADANVISFGFYDNELTVRLNVEKF
jgi:hypothetical protein